MCELVRSCYITAGIDIRINRLQIFVGFHYAAFSNRDAQLLQAESPGICNTPDRDQYLVEFKENFSSIVLLRFANQHAFAVLAKKS